MKLIIKISALAVIVSCSLSAAQASKSFADINQGAGSSQAVATPGYIEEKVNIDLVKKLGLAGSARVTLTKAGAKELIVHFSEVNLQPGVFLRVFSPDEKQSEIINHAALYDGSGAGIDSLPVYGDTALVELIYPDSGNPPVNSDKAFISHFSYPEIGDDTITARAIIGSNQVRDVACYEHTHPAFYKSSLAVVNTNGSSGWNLAGGPYVMTNHHVAGDAGYKWHLLRYNHQNRGCNSGGAGNHLDLRTERVVTAGGAGAANDYALYAVNTVDYQEAGIRQIFGNLWFNPSQGRLPAGTPVYIPQHIWGGVKKMTDRHDDGHECKVEDSSWTVLRYNCDTDGGSSGSPVIMQKDNTVVGLHMGTVGYSNLGTTGAHVYNMIKSIVPVPTEIYPQTVGEGKVSVNSRGQFPYIPSAPISLADQDVKLSSLYEKRLDNYGEYSIFKARLRATGGATAYLNVRMQVNTPCGVTDLNATRICDRSGTRQLVMEVKPEDNASLTSSAYNGFITLRVTDLQDRLVSNLVIPYGYTNYDPFISPFAAGTPVTVFTMTGKTFESPQMTHYSNFGFVAVNAGQGPLVTSDVGGTGTTEIKVPLKNSQGDVKLVTLTAQRKTSCSSGGPMMSVVGCGAGARPASLILKLLPEHNPGLAAGRYTGILPLKQKRDGFEKAILVNIDITL